MLLRKSTGIPGEAGSERESGIEAGMYECAEAVYQNEIWRAASLKDENGNYKQELRLKMKKESQKHCFSCPECGESLILNAGNIRQPYFSHYAGSDCVLTSKEQAERNQLMRQAMLLLAQNSFPDAEIREYALLKGKMRSQLLVMLPDSKIALNYVSDFVKLGRLEDKIACMKEKGIKPVWFTPFRIAGREKLTTAEYLISAEQPVLKSIDWLNKLIYMKEYDADTDKVLWEECYSFAELRLDEEGEFVCREQIEPDESKLQQRRHQEMLEEKLEEERRLRLECGRNAAACLFRQKEASFAVYEPDQVVLRISKEEYLQQEYAYGQDFFMKAFDEYWVLKKLKGGSRERRAAAAVRERFLEYADYELQYARKGEEKGLVLGKVLQILEEVRDSREWLAAGS